MKFGLLIVGEKGRYVLGELINNGDKPEFVVTYKDNNVLDEAYVEISDMCREFNIKFYSTREEIIYDLFDDVDKVFVIGWQFLLKKKLDKLVIIHDSYLPEYKGWSPTVNYLIEGSHYLAATAFEPTDKMDTGDIYAQRKINITYPITIADAIQTVSTLYINLIYSVLLGAEKKSMVGKESFCMWRNKDDYNINWNWDSERIKRFVDAVGYPFDGAKTKINNIDLKIVRVEAVEEFIIIDRKSHVGKIFKIQDTNPIIVCGIGMLKIYVAELLDGTRYTFKRLKTKL